MSSGVFWLIDDEILAIPYNEGAFVGIAKSGNNYNHRLLWEFVKPKHCNKPFDYYPRGIPVTSAVWPNFSPSGRI